MTQKLTGQINEGWLGADRSSAERLKGGSEYIMEVVIGPTCKFTFSVIARSLDEAKSIINSFFQWNIDWNPYTDDPPTPIELFWQETVAPNHRMLSRVSSDFLLRAVERHGEEQVKNAIKTAVRRSETVSFSTSDDIARYVGGILRAKVREQSHEPVQVSGKATSTHAWKES